MANIERQLIELIATDRIDKPISSMSGKLKRAKPKLAKLQPFVDLFSNNRMFCRNFPFTLFHKTICQELIKN